MTGAEPPKGTFPNGIPIRGEIYTVRTVEKWNGRIFFTLIECPTVGVGGVDEGWADYLFSPLSSALDYVRIEGCETSEELDLLNDPAQPPRG